MKLTIIIPVFNEGKNITKVVETIETEVKTPNQILVVYDFKEDSTLPVIRKMQKRNSNIKLVKNNVDNGRGVINAIKTGFDYVEDGALVVMMADMADDPETVDKMYQKIIGGFDVVCGSRYSQGGKHLGGPLIKSFLSWLADFLAPFLLGIPTFDLTNAFKMYRKKVINSIKIESTGGFELSMEIVIKANFKKFKITEVPTIWQDRTQGNSRFQLLKWLPKYIHWYLFGVILRIKSIF